MALTFPKTQNHTPLWMSLKREICGTEISTRAWYCREQPLEAWESLNPAATKRAW
jgi:hypothetical protein